MLTASRQWLL